MLNPKRTLQEKLFWGFVLVTLFAIAMPAFLSRNSLYEQYIKHLTDQSFEQTTIIKSILETDPTPGQIDALLNSARENGGRLTIINNNGIALYDSHIASDSIGELDNHNDRPEVETARAKGKGISIRFSNTLGIDALYTAVTIGNNSVIRLATPLADVHHGFTNRLSALALIFTVAIAICLVLSVWITQKVRRGIDSMAEVVAYIANNKGGRRLTRIPGKEFLPLAFAVNQMAENIEEYVTTTTDQRAQLEIILDSIHEGILVLAPTGAIRRYNKALLELFPGVASAIDKQVIEAIPIPDLQHKVDSFLSSEAEDLTAVSGQNDEPLHFEYEGKFLVTHLSQPVLPSPSVGAVLVIYNATTIMRLERVRRDFITNISHELRTPLTAITGYAETLLDMDGLTPHQQKFGSIIHKHATAMGKVIHDLLDLTRIESNTGNIALEPISPTVSCREAIKLISEQAAQKNIRFAVSLPGKIEPAEIRPAKDTSSTVELNIPDTTGASGEQKNTNKSAQVHRNEGTSASEKNGADQSGRRHNKWQGQDDHEAANREEANGNDEDMTPLVMGNATLLTQVFRNLLENACRYSPAGGTIAISAHVDDGRMVFAVKDQGPGIAQQELSQIFERLYQVNKERNSGFSGIGLAICKHIIKLHKGSIWAESPFEEYATAMLFTLPLAGSTSNTPSAN